MATMAARHAVLTIAGERCDVIRASFEAARRFSKHFHDTYSIGFVRRGINVFRVNKRVVQAEFGSISVVRPGDVHDGGLAGVPWAYDCIFPSARLISNLAESMRGACGLVDLDSGKVCERGYTEKLELLFTSIFAAENPAIDVEEIAIDALGTLACGHATSNSSEELRSQSRVAKDAIGIIQAEWDSPLKLGALSQSLGISRFALIRAIAAATGLTPHAYLLQIRIDNARRMLGSGISIADVAARTGFADQSHLCREMKRRWGVTPNAFKHRAD